MSEYQEVIVGDTKYRFPADMPDEDIKAALQKELGKPTTPSSSDYGPLGQVADYFLGGAARTAVDPAYPVKQTPKIYDDVARSAANVATFNYADELSALADELIGRGSYEENVAAQRARDEQIAPHAELMGTGVGALAAGGMAGKSGLSLLSRAKPTYMSMVPRGAAEGAAYGAAYGSGAAEEGGRLQGALEGAGFGALTGGVTAGGARTLQKKMQPPTLEQMREEGAKAFQAAHQSGLRTTESASGDIVKRLFLKAKDLNFNRKLHPAIGAALKEAYDMAPSQMSFKDLHNLRRIIQIAGKNTQNPDQARIARALVDELDDTIAGLTSRNIVGGQDPLKAATSLKKGINAWRQYRKADIIEGLVERAQVGADQFSTSGLENSLRVEFAALAKNPKRLAVFNDAEKKLIREAARSGKLARVMRWLGKFAPRGIVSALGPAGGYAVGGPAGAGTVWTVGEGGKMAATAMRKASVNRLLELIKTGKVKGLSPEDARLLSSMIAGEQAGVQ